MLMILYDNISLSLSLLFLLSHISHVCIMYICVYFCNVRARIEYGRNCKDIGCLPRETCVMAYDSCSFNQQEGTNCGRYPTCQKRTDMQTPQQTGKCSRHWLIIDYGLLLLLIFSSTVFCFIFSPSLGI